MSDPVEIELKLEMERGDRKRLDASDALVAHTGETNHLVSTYFDTPDLDLRKAGYSLRVRRKGKQRIQTVKAEGKAAAGLFVRPEWERAIRGDKPVLNEASGPLGQVIGAEALARIVPIFVTEVDRTVRVIRTTDIGIEVAVDEGEIIAGDRRAPICEIELELGEGEPQGLFDFARRLSSAVPLRLGVLSKAERGYNLVIGCVDGAVKAEPVILDPAGDVVDSFQRIARSCLRQFRLNETAVLERSTAEPLHQARVGLRRLRSAIALYKPLLKADQRTASLDGELGWLTSQLGEVRNLDVLIQRVEDEGARDQLILARERTFAEVRAELVSARARLLMIDLAEWLALGQWRSAPADPMLLRQDVTTFASDVLDARRKRAKRRGRRFSVLDDAERHQLRIEAKKLRYATDFFESLYCRKKERRRQKVFIGALGELQEYLGVLNDLATGAALMAGLGITAKLSGAGKQERARLLHHAENAFDALIDAKPFWR